MGASHAGLVPLHSLPGAEQASWGGQCHCCHDYGRRKCPLSPGAGRDSRKGGLPRPRAHSTWRKGLSPSKGGRRGLLRPETDPAGLGGPACLSRAPSPGAAAGRDWQMDLPPAPALGKHIRRRVLLPGQAELTFPCTGGAGRAPPAPTPLMGSQRRESQMDAGPAVSARSMLGFPLFLSPSTRSRTDQERTCSHSQREEKAGPSQSFSHNSKTRTSFPRLPLTHPVAKPDRRQ